MKKYICTAKCTEKDKCMADSMCTRECYGGNKPNWVKVAINIGDTVKVRNSNKNTVSTIIGFGEETYFCEPGIRGQNISEICIEDIAIVYEEKYNEDKDDD
jgi:hypothetical protein